MLQIYHYVTGKLLRMKMDIFFMDELAGKVDRRRG
jgi:hypothetical protein